MKINFEEEAEKCWSEFEEKLTDLCDKRLSIAVKTFKEKFPKRTLEILVGGGWGVHCFIDRRNLDGSDLVEVRNRFDMFDFLQEALYDVDCYWNHTRPCFSDIKVLPTKKLASDDLTRTS